MEERDWRGRAAAGRGRAAGWVLVLCLGLSGSQALAGGIPPSWTAKLQDGDGRAEIVRDIARERAWGGYADFTPLAETLLAEAHQNPAYRKPLAELAAEAAPGDPWVHFGLAGLALRETSLGTALTESFDGLRLLIADPWVQVVWFRRIVALLCAAAWFAALALVMVGGLPRAACLAHDYCDSFPMRLRRWTPAAFAALTLAVLWAAGTGPAVLLWLLGLMVSPYLEGRGRVALGVTLALGCLLPVAVGGLAAQGAGPGERGWALYRAWKGDAGTDLGEVLAREFPEGSSNALFARARVARRGGDLDQAGVLLGQYLEAGGQPGRGHLELGNLAFLRGEYGAALAEYRLASEARPADAIPWLNRHICHLALLELAEADAALEKARALDPGATQVQQSSSQVEAGQLLPVSMPIPKRWVREELLGRVGTEVPWAKGIEQGLFLPVSGFHAWYLAVFALLFTALVHRSREERRSHRCPSCGFVVCPRCSRRVKGTRLCPGCWAAGREKEVDQAEKERRAENSAHWQRRVKRWRRLGDGVLPGWCLFLGGNPIEGALLGSVWALAAGWLALWALYPAPLIPRGQAGTPWLAILVLIASHASGIWLTPRLSRASAR